MPDNDDTANAQSQPSPGYRLVSEEMISFLWFQTAAITLHYFGIGRIRVATDAQRIDCVKRLGTLFLKHSDILSDDGALILDVLMQAADDLSGISGH